MGCDIHLNIVVCREGVHQLVKPPRDPAYSVVDPWPRWPGAARDYEAFALLGYTGRCDPLHGKQLPVAHGWPDFVPRTLMYAPGWDEYDHNERWISADALAEHEDLIDRRRFPQVFVLSTIVQAYARDFFYSSALLIFGFDN